MFWDCPRCMVNKLDIQIATDTHSDVIYIVCLNLCYILLHLCKGKINLSKCKLHYSTDFEK